MMGPFGFEPKKTMRARAFRLARALVARGHEVAIFMPPWHTPQQADRTWSEDGVHLRYISVGGGVLGITRRLLRETLAWQPHIIHAFKPKAYSGLAAWWLRQTHRRLPLVMDTDDWEGAGGWNDLDPYTPIQKRFFAWQERWGMQNCDGLTVASRALQTLALGHGVSAERVHYLPNGPGIDVPHQPPVPRSGSQKLLLYTRFFEFDVARLVSVLAQAMAALPQLQLLLVGASLHADDGAQFQQLMAQAGLWQRVEDAGWVEERALPQLLASAELGLYLMDDTLLNRTKCPVKLADMAAVGLPVVGEAVGQVPEYVIHAQTGLLRPSGDADGLAADLVRLLQDDALRARMGEAARARVQATFGWDKTAVSAEAIYKKLITA